MSNSIKIDPLGFREYDARWLYPKNINEEGIKEVGKGFGTQVINTQKNPRVAVGYDYRSYSEEVKNNFVEGLISTGCNVEDIGLCLSPTIYFSQFDLNTDAVAMITASHNENGWTGIKMGIEKGLTHCAEEMKDLKNHANGLICFIGGESNPLLFLKTQNQLKKTDDFISFFLDIFSDDFYFEIQRINNSQINEYENDFIILSSTIVNWEI